MIIIPAINAQTFQEAQKQIKQAAEFSNLIHLDVTDGMFSPAIVWGNPEDLKKLDMRDEKLGQTKFEVHLMVSNPEGVIDAWLRTGLVKRVIVHLEMMTDSVYILEKCKKYGAEAMLAINPGTEAERLLAHKDDFKYFQVLAVAPGWAGQKFRQEVIDKIKFLRQNLPDAIIEIDGGINPETAKLCKEAGADILVSASYIFQSENPKTAYQDLSRV